MEETGSNAHTKLVDIFAAYPGCLKATRGPATIGELDLVM